MRVENTPDGASARAFRKQLVPIYWQICSLKSKGDGYKAPIVRFIMRVTVPQKCACGDEASAKVFGETAGLVFLQTHRFQDLIVDVEKLRTGQSELGEQVINRGRVGLSTGFCGKDDGGLL